jgi:prepilin-type N-terminal cleavage/methylation domain-containing protein
MLKINNKLCQKGFSLIELMVAVVILVMAIFGIFHAYSTGFMGMADARDRTVATNYLQQTIEDFKNMNFNQVQNEPITPIPNTKFSRGTYVLNLEEIDDVVTLKKVISQVRWIDRKGNIKTEKASTIIYNKPATSEVGDEAVELFLYAQSYYTIMPTNEVSLVAEIKDENGNIYDYDGEIIFSVVTVRVDGIPIQVGDITTEPPIYANDGVAYCTFTAISAEELAALGGDVEGTERIQATATIDGENLIDTVNIRVTTGPIGILIEPVSEEDDRVLAAGAGVESNLKLYVVKADYETHVEYDSPITLSADGPGTLSETTITTVPTDGVYFKLASDGDGNPGIVEITASAPDLDIGYIEITFTGEPASILVTPERNSIYPGEDIGITVTIVDVNNIEVSFTGEVNLSVLPIYGSFNDDSLSFTGQSWLDTTVFTADSDATPGETITIQANSGSISGSTEILILSSLNPYYLSLFAFPSSVDLSKETSRTITATVYDDSGNEIVNTYNTAINFVTTFGNLSSSSLLPDDGEAEVILTSGDPPTAGTATITASSGSLILTPEGGIEISFYDSATHIVLSADPDNIEADGFETSIITATVCDVGGNRVANYGDDPYDPKTITLSLTDESKGIFYNGLRTIVLDEFDEGMVTTSLSSTETGTATITALSSDGLIDNGFTPIALTGDIPSVLTLGEVTNWDDYFISFDFTVTGAPIYLDEIKIEWDNSAAPLDQIVIKSPDTELGVTKSTETIDSPSTLTEVGKTLIKDVTSNIGLSFRNGVSKMKQKNIIVTFTEADDTTYNVSFRVPNM